MPFKIKRAVVLTHVPPMKDSHPDRQRHLKKIQAYIARMPSLSTTVLKVLETCNDPNADQPLHSCFTPSLSLVTYLDCESLANIHFLSSKKMHHLSQEHRLFLHGRLKVPALMAEFAGYFPVRT